jgi:hypothetical protein
LTGLVCREIALDELAAEGDFLQSPVWARHKEAFGWRARAFRFAFADGHPDEDAGCDLLVLTRRLFAGLSISYVPHGPVLADVLSLREELRRRGNDALPAAVLSAMAALIRPYLRSSIVLRYDLSWPLGSPFPGQLAGRSLAGSPAFAAEATRADGPAVSWEDSGLSGGRRGGSALVKSSADIQPPDTVNIILDAEAFSEEDLLGAMKSKTRYNIRLAAKKGVQVQRVGRSDYCVPPELGTVVRTLPHYRTAQPHRASFPAVLCPPVRTHPGGSMPHIPGAP